MLNWALVLFVIAVGAAIPGFGGGEGNAVALARAVSLAALTLFGLSVVVRLISQRP